MPKFGERSLKNLKFVDPQLQMLCQACIEMYDFSVIYGHRGKEDQERLFEDGKSKLHWPASKHNSFPSKAVDLAPYPIDWSNKMKSLARFYQLSGYMLALASRMGLRIRVGLDWDSDSDFTDQTFNDLGHYEID